MKITSILPVVSIVITCSFISLQVSAATRSPSEIARIAKNTTISISSDEGVGSGVLIKHQGRRYFVTTAAHVVKKQNSDYSLTTVDGMTYTLSSNQIQRLPGVDLAIVQFESDRIYSTATLGRTPLVQEGDLAYVSGFPQPTAAISEPLYTFNDGRIKASSNRPLSGGYTIIYSCNTLPGMSGGGVWNDLGELIAIHGKGDIDTKIIASSTDPNIRIKTGFNLGIPSDTLIKFAAKSGLNLGINIEPISPTVLKPDDFLVSGYDKYLQGNWQAAIADYDRAIGLQPRSTTGYLYRGLATVELGQYRKAISDYDRALQLDNKLAEAHVYRGVATIAQANLDRSNSGDTRPLAIADFNLAITLNSNYATAFYHRGRAYLDLGDYRDSSYYYLQASEDFDLAISFKPQDPIFYDGRGLAKIALGNFQSAVIDLNRAVSLQPQFPIAYIHRAIAKNRLGDRAGALNDFNRALQIDPKFAFGYQQRGVFQSNQGESELAIIDLDRAIELDPQNSLYYEIGGDIRSTLALTKPALQRLAISYFITALNLAQKYQDRSAIDRLTQKIQRFQHH
jgi:tetratricopeptide (TPR) repeat protein